MRALIVEEDYISRLMLQRVVSRYASECLSTANGEEALTLFMRARRRGLAYDLICLDVTVPEMDGQTLLRKVRAIERRARSSHSRRAKVIMATALSDFKNLSSAFWDLYDDYLVKPINKHTLLQHLRSLGLCPVYSHRSSSVRTGTLHRREAAF